MKREIKFRGKRIDNGKWVYGMFYALNNHPLDVKRYGRKQSYYFERIPSENEDNEGRGSRNLGEVDPKTIGQYTGLDDYSGNEIYEGDIIRVSPSNLPEIVKVGYKNGSFVLVRDKKIIDSIWGYDPDGFDVIGNIHDNPELMEGGERC